MDLAALYQRLQAPALSSGERLKSDFLIVESEVGMRNSLRQALVSTGFSSISDAPNHAVALKRLEERNFTHVIFEAKNSSMPAREFLQSALEINDEMIMIPSSYEPTVDEVLSYAMGRTKDPSQVPPTTMQVEMDDGEDMPGDIDEALDELIEDMAPEGGEEEEAESEEDDVPDLEGLDEAFDEDEKE